MVIKVTACCGPAVPTCTSSDGYTPTMEAGDVLGHETMGEVVEVGRGVQNLKVGDRVVVPFNIACGEWRFAPPEAALLSLCDRSNRGRMRTQARKAMGQSPSGLSAIRTCSADSRGQAEFLRVPMPTLARSRSNGLPDEQVLFLSDIFPTGYMAAEECRNRGGRHGRRLGLRARRPVRDPVVLDVRCRSGHAIDNVPERLALAATKGRAEIVNFDVMDRSTTGLMETTSGLGPDRRIDAVGAEAHGSGSFDAVIDKIKAATLPRDRPASRSARGDHVLSPKGGTIVVAPACISAIWTRS